MCALKTKPDELKLLGLMKQAGEQVEQVAPLGRPYVQ
jgi:hypothetical protein